MKNFYTEFDYEKKTIQLAGNAHNSWSIDIATDNGVEWIDSDSSEEETSDALPTIDIIMIVLATVLFTTFGIFVCIKCKSKGASGETAESDVN
jgi:hypothetical protein